MIMRFVNYFFNCVLEANLIAILGLSCSQIETGNENEASSVHSLDSFQDIINDRLSPNYEGFEAYQYFDEYLMRGVGKPSEGCCVFVKDLNDTIIVRCKEESDSIYRYVNIGNCWVNKQYFDFDRTQYLKDGRFRRSYLRFICEGEIFEYRKMYNLYGHVLNSSLINKTEKSWIYINLGDSLLTSDDPKECLLSIRGLISQYKSRFSKLSTNDSHIIDGIEMSYSSEKGYIVFTKSQYKGNNFYMSVMRKDTILLKPLPKCGLPFAAGFERCTVTYLHKLDTGTLYDIYYADKVDVLPCIEADGTSIEEFVKRQTEATKKYCNHDSSKRKVVVVELVISNTGRVISIKKCNSINSVYDETALRICSNIPQLKPALKAGHAVAVRMTIPVWLYD